MSRPGDSAPALVPELLRGINLQIAVPDADSIAAALAASGVDLFLEPETRRYRVGAEAVSVRQFLVTDPDGYLIRFQSSAPEPVGG